MIIDKLFEKLGGKEGEYHELIYELTEGNDYSKTLDTPQLWGRKPDIVDYIPAGMNLINEIKSMIGSAKQSIDISTLSPFPDGLFLEAIKEGIKETVSKGNYPVIRIMEGVYYENVKPPWSETVPKILQSFLLSLEIPNNVPVYAAAMQTSLVSWNHAKLIIIDGEKAITGGHNMWNTSYCDYAPITDLSIHISGPCVKTAQQFLNKLWEKTSSYSRTTDLHRWYWTSLFFNQKFYPNALPMIKHNSPKKTGNTRVLSLGKLGVGVVPEPEKTNPSRTARIEAIKMAKNHVRMSQQMLGSIPNGYDPELMDAIVNHIAAKKHFSLIISDTFGMSSSGGPYSGFGIARTASDIAHWLQNIKNPPWSNFDGLIKHLETYVHIGPVRICDKNENDLRKSYWGWRKNPDDKFPIEPGNHCKFYMIDEDVFYVGSDNAYDTGPVPDIFHGLQEYGFMLEGKSSIDKILNDYWNKAWHYSSQFKISNWREIVLEKTETQTVKTKSENNILTINENLEGDKHE